MRRDRLHQQVILQIRRIGTEDRDGRRRMVPVADEEEVVARSEVTGRHLRLPLPHDRRSLRARQRLGFGIIYATCWHHLEFAMILRNFASALFSLLLLVRFSQNLVRHRQARSLGNRYGYGHPFRFGYAIR